MAARLLLVLNVAARTPPLDSCPGHVETGRNLAVTRQGNERLTDRPSPVTGAGKILLPTSPEDPCVGRFPRPRSRAWAASASVRSRTSSMAMRLGAK